MFIRRGGVRVFNATFNNISVILWQSILQVGETRVPRENHRTVVSAPHPIEVPIHNFSYKKSSACKDLPLGNMHCIGFTLCHQYNYICQCHIQILLFLNNVFVQHILTVAKSHILSVLSSEALTSILLSLDQATSDIPCKILICDYFVKTANQIENNSPRYLRDDRKKKNAIIGPL